MLLTFLARPEEDGALLRNFLRARGVSASLLRSVKTHGGFFCDGCEIHTNRHIAAGSTVSFSLPPEAQTSVLAQNMPLAIAYESVHAMALNKPAGLTVHPTLGYPDGTLANAFCGEMQRRGAPRAFRPINRIDRNTSGLVLCAMHEYAAPLLAGTVQKVYYAIAQGDLPDSGEIDAPIGLCDDSFIVHCVREGGKPSVTRYHTLWRGEGLSLAAVTPVTGRTHQIRVHFAHLGHPLAGDDLYGGNTARIARHALHCGRVEFTDIAARWGVQVQEKAVAREGNEPDVPRAKAPGQGELCREPTLSLQNGKIVQEQCGTIVLRSPLPEDMCALLPPHFILKEGLNGENGAE